MLSMEKQITQLILLITFPVPQQCHLLIKYNSELRMVISGKCCIEFYEISQIWQYHGAYT